MRQKSIKRNMFFSVILSVSGILLPLITYPYLTRVLQPENMGKLAYVSSIMTYFQWFVYLGIPVYGQRKSAVIREDKTALSRFVLEVIVLNICSIILALVILSILVVFNQHFFKYGLLFFIYSFNVFFSTLNLEWFFKGVEEYEYIAKRGLAVSICVMILTFLLIKKETDYILYAILSVVASFGTFLFNIIHVRSYLCKVREKISFRNVIRHLPSSLQFGLINVITTIYTSLDTVMLGNLCGDTVVGYYSVATKIKSTLNVLMASVSGVMLSRMSQYFRDRKDAEFRKMLEKILNLIILISIPLVIFFMIHAKACIYIIAGENYDMSIRSMQILMPVVVASGLTAIFGYQIFIPVHKEKDFLKITILGLIIDYILNILLIPKYGSFGASLATLFAEIIILVLEIVLLRKLLCQLSIWGCFFKTLFSSAISAALSECVLHYLSLGYFIELVISFVFFGGIWYLGLMLSREKLILECNRMVINWLKRRIK